MAQHLFSPAANCINFKRYQPGSLPNDENTLHENNNVPGKLTRDYLQPFDIDDTATLQFISDVITVPTMEIYNIGVLIETITGTLAATHGTTDIRYTFNFDVDLPVAYVGKRIYIKVTQGTEILLSEPIKVYDMTADLFTNKSFKKIEYSNFDAYNSELSDKMIDWPALATTDHLLFFYIPALNHELADTDESENLDESLNKTKISATNYFGCTLKTNPIPKYIVRLLKLVSNLDYFAANGIKYLKDGGIESEPFGNTTSYQATIKLTNSIATNINVDNLTFEAMTQPVYSDGELFTDKTAAFSVDIPAGYFLHLVMVKHSATSSGNTATVTIGSTLNGSDFVEGSAGQIDETGQYFTFDNPSIVSKVYIGIAGAAVKLDIYVNWLLMVNP